MTLDIEAARKAIVGELRRLRKTRGDTRLQKYLGSPYPVLGLTTPEFRAVMGAFHAEHRHLSPFEVNRLAAALWAGRVLEEKVAAINLLSRHAGILDDRSWRIADRWVDEAIGWALSDSLASGPISDMAFARPERFRELLRWTRAENFWRRRAATYALNRFIRSGLLEKPFRLLERLLYDEGYRIDGAKRKLRQASGEEPSPSPSLKRLSSDLRAELDALEKVLDEDEGS